MTSLSEVSEEMSTIDNQNKKIMKQILRMEKRRTDDNKELLAMLKAKNEQGDSGDKNESVGKAIIEKGTNKEIQQVEKFRIYCVPCPLRKSV